MAVYPIVAGAVAGAAAYFAAPLLAVRRRRDLRKAMPRDAKASGGKRVERMPGWLRPLRARGEKVAAEAGYRAPWAWMGYWACVLLLPAALALLGLFAGRTPLASAALALAASACALAVVASRRAARSRALTRNAYKAYRFLDAQVGSGIRATDAVRGLHEVMDDPEVRDAFVRFVAAYELTLDLDRSLDELRRSFSGHDAEMLCVGIRQCVDTGGGGRMLWRLEEIMFSKYFNVVQKETEAVRTKLVAAALLAAAPLVMLFLLPVLYDAALALGSVLS